MTACVARKASNSDFGPNEEITAKAALSVASSSTSYGFGRNPEISDRWTTGVNNA
jgi:hypothetical protein